jgi:FMN phosphatase YigB (HAD superfamily)
VGSPRLAVAAITIDFGNTLVMVDQPSLRAVVQHTGDALVERGIVTDLEGFMASWIEERERQFREDIPEFREPDIEVRAVRVLARLRGFPTPPAHERWDDEAAAVLVDQAEVAAVAEAYGAEFVSRMDPVPDATATLETLSGRGFALAILSNWPLAATIDRFAAAHGWLPYLQAIVVSQRVGWIKPHAAIFRAAEAALGLPEGSGGAILHVGDDWAADVVGARQAGWRAAYVRGRQVNTPLPTSEPGDGLATGVRVTPDLEIDELVELDGLVELNRLQEVSRT